jgi:hypothetical protein
MAVVVTRKDLSASDLRLDLIITPSITTSNTEDRASVVSQTTLR